MTTATPTRKSAKLLERRRHRTECRAVGDFDDSPRIFGQAVRFLSMSSPLGRGGSFVEMVAPSAFNMSRAEGWPNVMARWNHEDQALLGTTAAGTLSLSLDRDGLNYEVQVPNTSAGHDAYELVRRGDVSGSSFAFITLEDHWEDAPGSGDALRVLDVVKLVDVAPVNWPAYPSTTALARTLDASARTATALQQAGLLGAYMSLCRFSGATLDEVLEAEQRGQLRKFVPQRARRTSPAPPPRRRRLTGRQALVLSRREPS